MFVEHPNFETPPDETPVLRYMRIAKLVSILSSGQLYFRRLDKLPDEFEGTLPSPTFDRTHPWLTEGYYANRQLTAINCWSIAHHECDGMWRVYTLPDDGIAIQSTVGRLKNSFPKIGIFGDCKMHIGRVRYVDYSAYDLSGGSRTAFNSLLPVMHKKHEYAYEHEVRLVLCEIGCSIAHAFISSTDGVSVPISPSTLIEKIRVTRTAPDWYLDSVKDLMQRFGFAPQTVLLSDLSARPRLHSERPPVLNHLDWTPPVDVVQ